MKRIGIAGASECGKTTLAIHLSRAYWTEKKIPSLVLDPWKGEHQWGKQAWVTSNEKVFWAAVWERKNDLVIVDDGSLTIARDRELVPAFTAIRHQGHTLMVVCHGASDLLPTMRRQFNELFLFAQNEDDVETWQKDLPLMRGISESTVVDGRCKLKPYEFLQCENYKDGIVRKLAI